MRAIQIRKVSSYRAIVNVSSHKGTRKISARQQAARERAATDNAVVIEMARYKSRTSA